MRELIRNPNERALASILVAVTECRDSLLNTYTKKGRSVDITSNECTEIEKQLQKDIGQQLDYLLKKRGFGTLALCDSYYILASTASNNTNATNKEEEARTLLAEAFSNLNKRLYNLSCFISSGFYAMTHFAEEMRYHDSSSPLHDIALSTHFGIIASYCGYSAVKAIIGGSFKNTLGPLAVGTICLYVSTLVYSNARNSVDIYAFSSTIFTRDFNNLLERHFEVFIIDLKDFINKLPAQDQAAYWAEAVRLQEESVTTITPKEQASLEEYQENLIKFADSMAKIDARQNSWTQNLF